MFKIKKYPDRWIILATGQGWEHCPQLTNATIIALNDFVHQDRFPIRPDLICMMDNLEDKPSVVSGKDNIGEMVAKINSMKIPFIAPYKYEEIPLSEAFPLEEARKEFGIPYYSNTICYMIAYALLKGAKEIEFYGVNQAGSGEYTEERPAVEYWIGIATQRGVKVTINGKNSQLLRYKGRYGESILYGYGMTYEEVRDSARKFGEPTVKKLFKLPAPYNRKVRTIKNEQNTIII